MFPPEAPFFLEQGKGIQKGFAVRGERCERSQAKRVREQEDEQRSE